MRALEELDLLQEDVRHGRAACTSRSRLVRQLLQMEEDLTGSAARSREEIRAALPSERFHLLASKQLGCRLEKVRRIGACLACTLRPCLCQQLPPLRLRHRLWLLMHANEALRTTNSGKLLLLAHPDATLLVRGIREHDRRLAELVQRPSAVVLYPDDNALTPAECLARAQRADVGEGGGVLDLIIIDGTWSQARMLARQLPSTVPRVALDLTALGTESRSLFGSSVRTQSAEREASGRVCTLEAYALLAEQIREDPDETQKLRLYLSRFIEALEPIRPTLHAAMKRRASVQSGSDGDGRDDDLEYVGG